MINIKQHYRKIHLPVAFVRHLFIKSLPYKYKLIQGNIKERIVHSNTLFIGYKKYDTKSNQLYTK